MSKKWVVLLALALASLSLAQKIGDCELTGKKGEYTIKPVVPGQLTVQTNLPAPGWWNGDTPQTIKSGFEYCLAANIAYRAGLDKVVVQNVSFDALVAGQTKAFDLALSQVTITDERKKVVDFSPPYFSSDQGLLVRKGTKVNSSNIKSLKIGVQQGTTAVDFVKNVLKVPAANIRVFPDTPNMFTALQARQVDVVMLDTAIVLVQAAKSNGALEVVGQYKTGESYGAIYPKNSPNRATFDRIIQALNADGTIKKLTQAYLAKEFGGDPTAIPYLKP
ncbi:extracellular solute-binding protein family 3 [Allomeiothermus silvanus DSM 9946]|uniref:Extracellular solute-binding protein family 3 n=1 Tax=Allomeiothermus silvanus (strain ATCC 700542 / DSM 9946 / NBRC 106475 / NCIMB 13440 / VI-R2) TaxID=526227 RepID=D7BCR5_ALLS1|nr:ABC transporter substrate-binding protein [Allomeiothermus silvanus]ADH64648.1 extracellular solute-binding protein family 3 [Allomeiothermus silvanus DSM 9946]